jgi:hypothetical protein
MRRLALLGAVLLLSACFIAVDGNGEDRSPRGAESWSESAKLRIGEPVFFDGGRLRITLRSIDVAKARIRVRDVGAERLVDLNASGRVGGVQWPPYTIWLDSIGIDNTATIIVSKNQ